MTLCAPNRECMTVLVDPAPQKTDANQEANQILLVFSLNWGHPCYTVISQREGTVPLHNAQVYDPNGGSFQGLLSCFILDFILEKLRLTFYAEIWAVGDKENGEPNLCDIVFSEHGKALVQSVMGGSPGAPYLIK